MKLAKTLKKKRFWIPTIIVIVLAIILIIGATRTPAETEEIIEPKKVEVITVKKQDEISSSLELKGTILPKEYTRVKSLVSANLQFISPIGSEVNRGDTIATLSDQRIEDTYFAALQGLQDSQQNLAQTQSLNVESINQAELGVASADASLKLAQDNYDSLVLLTEQNLFSTQDSARITYQSAYNLIEEVIRYWGGGTLSDFILENTPTANKELLGATTGEFETLRETFNSTDPKINEGNMTQSIAYLEPIMDQTKDFNDSVVRVLNFAIVDSSKNFSQQAVDNYRFQAGNFTTRLNTTNSGLKSARNGLLNIDLANRSQLLGAQNQLDQATIQAENARAVLESAKRQTDIRELGAKTQLTSAQTQFAAAQSQYSNLFLTAPFSGVIIAHRASEGDQVSPGIDLIEMGQINAVEIELAINEENRTYISLGQPVTIDGSIIGTISEIAPSASLSTGKVAFTVVADNPDQIFTPGAVADVTIDLTVDQPNAIVLPLAVVTVRQDDTFVYVVKDNHVVKQSVTLGNLFDSKVTIDEGLEEGDQVIIKNGDFLDEGEEVIIK